MHPFVRREIAETKRVKIEGVISIIECHEPLEKIDGCHPRIFTHPYYARIGIPDALSFIYVRKSVKKRIIEAALKLPTGFNIAVYDGFRPFSVQAHIFKLFFKDIQKRYPQWSEEAVLAETRKYASFPNDGTIRPSPHITGGAIDVTLCNDEGVPFFMGGDFDETSSRSQTAYYETATTKEDIEIRNLRRLLYHTMYESGFENYYEEWWHYDYGNQGWAESGDHPFAIYGKALY